MHPEALKDTDLYNGNGYTPPHFAFQSNSWFEFEAIWLLLKEYLHAIKKTDRKGYTPLHDACIAKHNQDSYLYCSRSAQSQVK
eukprot:445246-Ditylum_brightwellii.AAC.1